MARFGKKFSITLLAVVIALSAAVFAPVTVSAEDKIITVAEFQKQRPELFTRLEFVEGYPLLALTGTYTIPKGTTLVIPKGDPDFLQIYAVEFPEGSGKYKVGKLIVDDGATLLVEGSLAIGAGRVVVNKGGVIIYADYNNNGYMREHQLYSIVNNGEIFAGEGTYIAQLGPFSGNRPHGLFALKDIGRGPDGRNFLAFFEYLAPGISEDDRQYRLDVFPSGDACGYSEMPIYWSVTETAKGFVYTAEIIPEYEYDAMFIDVVDMTKPSKVKGGTITFGSGKEEAVLKCVYDAVDKPDEAINSLIEKQGAKPVAGRTKEIPAATPAPTPTPIPTLPPIENPNGYKVGQKLGDVLFSNIKGYINGAEIPVYNIEGVSYVIVADLKSYGFDADFNNDLRLTTLSFNKSKPAAPLNVTANSGKAGEPSAPYLYTDIRVIVGGKVIESRNVNGGMAIPFNALKIFGEYKYDGAARSCSLTVK